MSSPTKRKSKSKDDPPIPTSDTHADVSKPSQQDPKPRTRKSSKMEDEPTKDDNATSNEEAQSLSKGKKGKEAANTEKRSTKKKSKPSSKAKKGGNSDDEDTDNKTAGKKSIKDRFIPWEKDSIHPPGEETVPDVQKHWGWVITTSDEQDFSEQPSAKDNSGQTEPPLWENRESPCVKGNRYLTMGNEKIDQQAHLVLRLLDMRAKSKDVSTPKREPLHLAFHGIPKDWNDGHAITKLNQSRKDYIKRVCCDKVWTNMEARFLAEQFLDKPDISIMELTCRLNDKFMGKHYIDDPQEWDNVSKGRTIECVRAEYLENQPVYDKGKAPVKTAERDRKEIVEASKDGLTVGQMMDADEANRIEVPKDKDGNPDYNKLSTELLRRHARQRKPEVSLAKAPKKADIVKRLEDADKNGVGKDGVPKGVQHEPQSPGTLSPVVVELVFEIDAEDDVSYYDAPIKRLLRSRLELLNNGQTQEAGEVTQLIKSLIAARATRRQENRSRILADLEEKQRARDDEDSTTEDSDVEKLQKGLDELDAQKDLDATQIAEAESIPRKQSVSGKRLTPGTGAAVSPSKKRKLSDSSRESSSPKDSNRSARDTSPITSPSGANDRKSSKGKINEQANKVPGPGTRANAASKATAARRKTSESSRSSMKSSPGVSKHPQRPPRTPSRRRSSGNSHTNSSTPPHRPSTRSQSTQEDGLDDQKKKGEVDAREDSSSDESTSSSEED